MAGRKKSPSEKFGRFVKEVSDFLAHAKVLLVDVVVFGLFVLWMLASLGFHVPLLAHSHEQDTIKTAPAPRENTAAKPSTSKKDKQKTPRKRNAKPSPHRNREVLT